MKNERIQDKLKLLIAKQEIEEEKMKTHKSSFISNQYTLFGTKITFPYDATQN
jgi:hypothetical protein